MSRLNCTSAAFIALTLVTATGAGAQSTGMGTQPAFLERQATDTSLASLFLGDSVTNAAGETIGHVADLLFDRKGQITTIVLGVGGFLSIGEKYVAVPFESVTITSAAGSGRTLTSSLSKAALASAPAFQPIEKSTFTRAKEKAVEFGNKAIDKAGELKDEAAKKIEDMQRDAPRKN